MQHFVARASTSVTRRFRCWSVRRKPWALRGAVAVIGLLGTTLLLPTAARGQVNPPTISEGFGADTVPLGGSTALGFALSNSNPMTNLTGVAFTDNLPAGLVVATPSGLTGTCIGFGTIAATAGSGSISFTGGTLPPAFACTIIVNVTGTTAGEKNNTTTAVTSNEGGAGNTAFDRLTVVAPPTIAKTFGAASVPVGGTTTLTFSLNNPNGGPLFPELNGVAFTDALPTGLVVATPNGLSNTCGGTIAATAGSGTISLTGGHIRGGFDPQCSVRVSVTATTAGDKPNTTGPVTSDEGGTGGTASASLTVLGPPTIAKTFGAASVPVGGTTSLNFTITNPNASVALTGVAFTDTLPTGLVVATPNGLTGSCGSTPAATAGSGSVSLTGGALPAGGSCLFAVNVTATAAGVLLNTTGTVTSTNAGAGNAAVASLTVSGPTTLTPTPPPGGCILGDINCDGIVDIRDYGLWRANFGQTNCGNPADLDGTCIVDIRDYGIWRANFGHTAGGAAPRSAPSTLGPTGTAIPPPTRTPRPAAAAPAPLGSRSAEGDRESTGDPPARPPELLASGLLVAGLFWRLRRRRDD